MPSDHSRYCIIEPGKGPVRIEISIDKALIAGGELRLIDEKKQFTMERAKVTVDDKQSERIVIKKPAEELHLCYLIWQFLVCSVMPEIYTGKVYLEVFQGTKECHLTIPAELNLKNIPPCRLKAQEKASGALSFILKKKDFKMV